MTQEEVQLNQNDLADLKVNQSDLADLSEFKRSNYVINHKLIVKFA